MSYKLVTVAFGLILLGCNTEPSTTRPGSPNPSYPASLNVSPNSSPDIVVTRENPSLPANCSPRETAALVVRFFDAFNRGDADELSHFFGASFVRYAVADKGDVGGAPPTSVESLLTYFAERHKRRESLQLVTIDVAGPAWHGGVDLSYALLRRADDLVPAGPKAIFGKGSIDCATRTIIAWAMGGTVPPARLCPDLPTPTARDVVIVIACARKN